MVPLILDCSPCCLRPLHLRFGVRGSRSFFPACDGIGAPPPFPYAMGAGYIFSSALLKWAATDPSVVGWIEAARGPDREALQWQKFEDTSTGYWLTYSPQPVEYVDIGAWIHDMVRRAPRP